MGSLQGPDPVFHSESGRGGDLELDFASIAAASLILMLACIPRWIEPQPMLDERALQAHQ